MADLGGLAGISRRNAGTGRVLTQTAARRKDGAAECTRFK